MKTRSLLAIKGLLVVILLLSLASPGCADDWTPVPIPPDSPMARFGHSMVTLPDSHVLLFGGGKT